MKELQISGYHVVIREPIVSSGAVVYLPGHGDMGRELWELLPFPEPVLVTIDGLDWNRDLSPWPAERVFRDGEDFCGGATKFLEVLTDGILPEAENVMQCPVKKRCIAGYSMGGLFALWCLYHTRAFQSAASVSGSLWYDGFIEHMKSSELMGPVSRVYLSVGSKEKKTRNRRMASVEECTRNARELLLPSGVSVNFTVEPGNHFQNASERLARGIAYIVQE